LLCKKGNNFSEIQGSGHNATGQNLLSEAVALKACFASDNEEEEGEGEYMYIKKYRGNERLLYIMQCSL
jgi:hypothetical protein